MTIGATVQRVFRREPLSEELKNQADGAVESRIPSGEQQDERLGRPEQLLRHVSD